MTALDQAFIKAFSQQGTSPAPCSAGRRASPRAPADARPPDEARHPSNEAAPLPISDVFRDMLATLQPTPVRRLSIKDEPLAAASELDQRKTSRCAGKLDQRKTSRCAGRFSKRKTSRCPDKAHENRGPARCFLLAFARRGRHRRLGHRRLAIVARFARLALPGRADLHCRTALHRRNR